MALPAQAGEKKSSYFVSYNSSNGTTILHTTGVGQEPKRSLSSVQKRLLAKRAATVNGYRNLLRANTHFPEESPQFPFVVEEVSGFLKGVEVEQTRFFSDGRVEVDMRVPLTGTVTSFEQFKEFFVIQSIPVPVYEVKTEKKYITKEEYEQLFRQ